MIASDLQRAVIHILQAGLVPMIAGSPGVGKSDIIRTIAKKFNLFVIDYRLAQCDPTDLLGYPSPKNGERMGYLPPEEIPIEGDAVPDGYDGWLLFFDEFTSAFQSVQAAAYKVVLDKKVGKHAIHSKCAIVCAGNKQTDNAIVTRMGTAMQSRLVHLDLDVAVEPWVEWANKHDIDHRVVSYLESHPDKLHLFKPDHDDKTFACPRTWEFTSKLIKNQDVDNLMLQTLIGTLSAGVANGFHAYLEYCADLPSIDDIKKEPEMVPIPEEPGLLYAVSNMVAAYMGENNADRLMRFIKRLPLEFGTTSIRAALARRPELLKIDEVREWAHEVAAEIF